MFHHTPKISTFLISFLSSATISMSSIPTLLSHSNLLHILVMSCWYSQPHVSFVRCLHSGHYCGTFAPLLRKFPPAGSPATTPRCCFPNRAPLKFFQIIFTIFLFSLPIWPYLYLTYPIHYSYPCPSSISLLYTPTFHPSIFPLLIQLLV
ncbi:uncharacterized protein VICG_02187, partial [Vittaforma corneae ATCC 50505]